MWDVLDIHHRHGVKLNPLYLRGHERVGCFPCIFSTKEDLRLIAELAPWRVEELRQLEAELTELRAARNAEEPGRYRHGRARFFQKQAGRPDAIEEIATWARTERGGRQLPLVQPPPSGGCFRWGMCEPPAGAP